jgi:hypothetical protein
VTRSLRPSIARRHLGTRAVAAVAAALFAGGYSAPRAGGGTIRDDRDPARYTALASESRFASVGLLEVDVFQDGQPAVGSGTLVAPGWVMTAAHVLEGSPRGVRFTVNGQSYAASRWVLNKKYTGDLIKGNDIALVQLSVDVPGVTPAKLYRGSKEANAVGTFVGFGRTGNGLTGDVTDDRVKRAGTNAIDGYLTQNAKGQNKLSQKLKGGNKTFAVDFDQPGNAALNVFGSPEPTDLEFLISPGDSGGPTFIDDPAGGFDLVVVGIHSYGEIFDLRDDSSYGDVVGETRVSKFAKWVDDVVNKEKVRNKLKFITPTAAALPQVIDPAGRSIPAAPGVPEPTAAGAALLAGVAALCRRPGRHRR